MDFNDDRLQTELLGRWEAMRDRVVASLRGKGWSEDDAQDLFGEALLRAITRKDSLDDLAAAEGWFWQLAQRVAIDEGRRRSSRPRRKDAFELDTLAAPVEEPDDVCPCSLQLLAELPRGTQEILRAVDLEGIPVQDYASSAEISPNNASVRLFRARRALRKRMFETCQTTTVAECMECGCE